MATATSKPAVNGDFSSSVELAIRVIAERIQGFSKEDQSDIIEMIGVMVSCASDEEKEEAKVTLLEILSQKRGQIIPLEDAGEHNQEQSKWAGYVGARIRDERKKHKLTQEQLAAKAGLQQAHVSRIESGVHSPNRKTMKKIAKALGLPISHFDPSEDG